MPEISDDKQLIKESSDEFNPAVALPRRRWWRVPQHWTGRDYVAAWLATWGVGYLPVAPGTWGSLVGLGFYAVFKLASLPLLTWGHAHGASALAFRSFRMSLMLLLIGGLFVIGIKAATRMETLTGRKDPGIVVVDEVVGQLITFLFIPFEMGWWTVIVGFFLFRLFDIWKPYPIRRLESLESGLGIMADDVLAGAYAATVLSIITTVFLLARQMSL